MTEADLVLIAKAIAPVVRDLIVHGQADLRERLLAVEGVLGTVTQRITAVEAREPAAGPPGPPGPAGRDGQDGLAGKDGAAGLTYRGVFLAGADYQPGDLVTWGGSAWHCNAATTARPGEAAEAWTLMVKRGRDGKGAT